jgi:hypothetical protein
LRFYVIRIESGTRADFSHCERDIFKLDTNYQQSTNQIA